MNLWNRLISRTRPQENKSWKFDYKSHYTENSYIAFISKSDCIDWYRVVHNPPPENSKAHYFITKKASSWITCACGNACKNLPRNPDGSPHDPILRMLGTHFAAAISGCHWDFAKDMLINIEAQSKHLLNFHK